MKLDSLVDIRTQDSGSCVCDVHLNQEEFVAYFAKSTVRQVRIYYLYNVLDKTLYCIEPTEELARYRGNADIVALLEPNRELTITANLHSLAAWERNRLYLLFPDAIKHTFQKKLYFESTINDANFYRMGLPRKDPSGQWIIDEEEEEIL